MSEHSTKGHGIAAFIMLAIISVLAAWGFGLMNSGDLRTGAAVGVLLFLFGTYVLVSLAPGDDA